jgi:hypothetical protein
MSISYPFKICDTCGHLQDEHSGNSCSAKNTVYSDCTCNTLRIIEISDGKQLGKEFYRARETHSKFLDSLKKNGIPSFNKSNFEQAVLLYSKEESLWRLWTKL